MKLVADSGLWSTGPIAEVTPLVAILEVSGAVLSWTLDAPDDPAAATQITFTDPARADWLWRVLGESGHVTLASVFRSTDEPQSVEVPGVDILPGSVAPLRRLALGHWLRRWWPASRQDGIAGLDRALLDLEVAVLTAGAQDFFADDTLDSDVARLLAPHAAALTAHVADGDPRVLDLVRAGTRLADEVGVDGPGWAELCAALDDSRLGLPPPSGRRDDYALAAAGGAGPRPTEPIARGTASINWGGVPPAIFDAGEDTVDWTIEAGGPGVVAVVRAAVIGPDAATGVAVQLRSGAITGTGALDAGGRATLPLDDVDHRPITESVAWGHDWLSVTSVLVGIETTESPETRERVRRWARARLDRPADDAFLAEILAAESAY